MNRRASRGGFLHASLAKLLDKSAGQRLTDLCGFAAEM